MASQLFKIGAILLSTVFFLMGNGLVGTLTPVSAHLAGFSHLEIGFMGACYFAGFVAGCVIAPSVLARVGHVRTFAVSAALLAVSVLIQPVSISPTVWFLLRAIAGFCIAGLFMALESWLNDRADNRSRGRLLSFYVMVNLSSLVAGQWLLLIAPPGSFELFSTGAIFYCLCLIPVGLTALPQPHVPETTRLQPLKLFAISPVGAAGCVTVGLANGAFWTLAPVYAQSLGFSTHELALFMSAFIAGGALIQWPLGRISDRHDRRWIMALVCAVAAACGLVLALVGRFLVEAPLLFFALVFVLGASMLPLYSLSIAHTNDRLPRAQFVEASAGLLLINAAAAVPGPVIASLITSAAGPHALFLYTALVQAAMAFFAFTRIRMHEPAAIETRDLFEPMAPQTSPAALPLDPRAPEET